MSLEEHLKKSIGIGICWGVGVGVFLFILITSIMWWENTFDGLESLNRGEIELDCYKRLDRETCNTLFEPYQ